MIELQAVDRIERRLFAQNKIEGAIVELEGCMLGGQASGPTESNS
jgi:hypothetical protein